MIRGCLFVFCQTIENRNIYIKNINLSLKREDAIVMLTN